MSKEKVTLIGLIQLGQVQIKMGQPEEAIKTLDQVIETDCDEFTRVFQFELFKSRGEAYL